MTPDRAFESHYSDLVSIINRIVAHMTDFSQVFSMVSLLVSLLTVYWLITNRKLVYCLVWDSVRQNFFFFFFLLQEKFLPFIDLLQKESVRVEVCKTIIRSFIMYVYECSKVIPKPRGIPPSACSGTPNLWKLQKGRATEVPSLEN